MSKKEIKVCLKCSNCGRKNNYTQKQMDRVFPYSRERLKCKFCTHTLSVTSGFL